VSVTRVAVDAGSLLTKIVVSGPAGTSAPRLLPAGPVGVPDALAAALAAARDPAPEVCLAVPDAWLDGSAEGAWRQEAFRHLAEEGAGLSRVRWAGQLAAVAALAASQRSGAAAPDPFAAPGRYLVCDAGGGGVRIAVCEVSGSAVRQLAVHDAPGRGWRDFDAAVRAAVRGTSDPGLADWYKQALAQDRRARLVFGRVRAAPGFADARVYSLIGAEGAYELSAAQAVECFRPAADEIRQGVATVLGSAVPVAVVLTGGLAWFPPVADTLGEAAGLTPLVLGPEAAAQGALLLADGQAALAWRGLPPVSLPMHQVRDGLLEEVSLPLPWTASFAPADGDPLVLDSEELTLDIGARRVTVPVPGLAAGRYRAGARPSWAGAGVLVLRAERTGRAGPPRHAVPPAGQAGAAPGSYVHVLPLSGLGRGER
jgi:hypothetical protein